MPPQVSAAERDASDRTEVGPVGPPPGDAPESNTGRKFPCPGCGAKLDFDPAARSLRCPYCGYNEAIDPTSVGVRERDWDDYWKNAVSHGGKIEGRSSECRCKACAAIVLLEDKVVTDKCPYCGNDLENRPVSAENMILPEGILPFKVDLKQALSNFRQWIAGRWFAPGDLRRLADVGKFNGIYVPFWTFDAMTYTRYTGLRGDNYQEVETYTDMETRQVPDGRGGFTTQTQPVTKTRIVTKIRWTPAAGNVDHFFDDVLIHASKSIPDGLMDEMGPWDTPKYEPFRPEFLAGFQTERYTVDLKEGFSRAQGVMEGVIRGLCCRDIGGDHQQLHSVQTQHAQIAFKHVLQPVWLAPYRYRDRLFRIAVNARTGEVVGTRPYSFWKIFLFVLMIVAIVAVIAAVAGVARGDDSLIRRSPATETQTESPPEREARPAPADDSPIVVVNRRAFPVEALPAERTVFGVADDYKPCVTRLRSGQLLAVAFHQHKTEGNKVREPMLFFRSDDSGRTWSEAESPPLLGREPYFSELYDGTLLITVHLLEQDERNDLGYTHSYVHRSFDQGETWETTRIAAEDVPGAEPRSWVLTSRNILQRDDSSLLLGVSAPGGRDYLWQSFDRGTTWDKQACLFEQVDTAKLWWPFHAETVFWEARNGDLLAIARVDPRVFPPLPGTAVPSEAGDQVERMTVFRSADDGRRWLREADLGTYGEMYPHLLRLRDGRLLLTFTVRALRPPLGLQAVVGEETASGFRFDMEHDRLVIDARTPADRPSGGGFGPTIQLPDGGLVSVYSFRDANGQTRLEAARWRLPERR